MRGLLNGEWEEIEEFEEASKWCGSTQYSIVNDPERGTFDGRDFEVILPSDGEAEEKLARIKSVRVKSYQATVFIGGDLDIAKAACRKFCDERGECVTVEPTDYIYTNGSTSGVRVGFINYGRFPRSRRVIFERATSLAKWLLVALNQESVSVVASDKTVWMTTR